MLGDCGLVLCHKLNHAQMPTEAAAELLITLRAPMLSWCPYSQTCCFLCLPFHWSLYKWTLNSQNVLSGMDSWSVIPPLQCACVSSATRCSSRWIVIMWVRSYSQQLWELIFLRLGTEPRTWWSPCCISYFCVVVTEIFGTSDLRDKMCIWSHVCKDRCLSQWGRHGRMAQFMAAGMCDQGCSPLGRQRIWVQLSKSCYQEPTSAS